MRSQPSRVAARVPTSRAVMATLDAVSVRCRYILANIETERGVKRGDRIWQIGFGSGFKCNSAVWRAMRNNTEKHAAWTDEEMEFDPKWSDNATWENVVAEKAAKAAA